MAHDSINSPNANSITISTSNVSDTHAPLNVSMLLDLDPCTDEQVAYYTCVDCGRLPNSWNLQDMVLMPVHEDELTMFITVNEDVTAAHSP